MDLKSANTIIARALEVGHKNGLNPLTVAVFDVGGNLVAFAKEDGASLFRQEIASGKALGALGLGMDSGLLMPIAEARPGFMQSAYVASGGKIIPVPGGVLVKSKKGDLLGAVGISGDLSAKDEACAIEGIKAAGLSCKAIAENAPLFITAHL